MGTCNIKFLDSSVVVLIWTGSVRSIVRLSAAEESHREENLLKFQNAVPENCPCSPGNPPSTRLPTRAKRRCHQPGGCWI